MNLAMQDRNIKLRDGMSAGRGARILMTLHSTLAGISSTHEWSGPLLCVFNVTRLVKLLKTGNGSLFYNGMRVLYAGDLQAITIAIRISHVVEYYKEEVNQCGYVLIKIISF